MKQLIPLFLFLLPCLAWAQYPSNGNQKITLGEQSTADGLIWRGVLADTGIITPSSDTSAYIILDTVNHRFYNYNRATNVWSVTTIGSISSGLTGVLPVANGGTNTSTAFTAGSVVFAGASGTYMQNNSGLFWDNTNRRLGIGTNAPTESLHFKNSAGTGVFFRFEDVDGGGVYIGGRSNRMELYAGGLERLRIQSSGNVGIGTLSPLAKLHVNGGGVASNINNVDSNSTFRFDLANPAISLSIGYANPYDVAYIQGSNNVNETSTPFLLNPYGGAIGIGLNGNPTAQLHVVGNARITAMNGINDIGADANGVLQAATSDMNLKNTIENSPFGLNEILLLNPVTFLYNDVNRKLDSNVKEVGFIAQDVFDIIPNAVSSTGTGDLQLDYRAITATLTKAIQEQQALIKALEQRIINLENK